MKKTMTLNQFKRENLDKSEYLVKTFSIEKRQDKFIRDNNLNGSKLVRSLLNQFILNHKKPDKKG